MKYLPNFEIEYKFPKLINLGGEGEIYRISHKKAVKIPWLIETSRQNDRKATSASEYMTLSRFLQHEFYIAKRLYESGFSVPKPEGVFNISFEKRNSEKVNYSGLKP